MPLTHGGHEAIDSHDAYNRIKNRKEDLDRQLKADQVRDQQGPKHPGKIARKSDN